MDSRPHKYTSRNQMSKRQKIDLGPTTNYNLRTRGESPKSLSPDISEERLRTHPTENQQGSLVSERNESVPKPSTNKKKELSLAERMKVMDYAEKFSERETALAFGISRSAVNTIKKNKVELTSLYEVSKKSGINRCRRIRSTCCEDINNKTWKWFLQSHRKKDPITNKQLQERALEYARTEGVTNFSASKGWLEAFKKRFGITVHKSETTIKNINVISRYLRVKKDVNNASEQFDVPESNLEVKGSPFPLIRLMEEVPRPTASDHYVKSIEEMLF